MSPAKTRKANGGARKRVAVYARISFDRSGERLGVERQIEACEELAERNGWDVIAHYVDNSISATDGSTRPEYLKMLADGEAGVFDVLIGWDSDRIVRLLAEALPLVALVERGCFDVATVNSGVIDLSSAGGRLVFKILVSVSEMETEHKRERMRLEIEQRRAAGRHNWPVRPFGYNRDGSAHETEGPIVVDMVRRFLAGDSWTEIARDLNERGVQTTGTVETKQARRRDGKWIPATVRALVTNPRNAALYPDEAPGSWTALVDLDTYRSVRALLRRHRTSSESNWLLTRGTMVCGRCGHNMSGSKHSSGADRYICLAQSGGCNLTVMAAPVDALVTKRTVDLLGDADQRGRIVAGTRDENAASETLDRIAKATDRKGSIVSLVRDGLVDEATARADLEGLNEEIDLLRARLSRLGSKSALLELPTGDALVEFWQTLTPAKRARIIGDLYRVTIMPTERRGRVFDESRVVLDERF